MTKRKRRELVKTSVTLDKKVRDVAADKAATMGLSLSVVIRQALLEFAQKPVPELLRDDLKE